MFSTSDCCAFALRWLFLGAAVGYFVMLAVGLVAGL